jgi:hypothetical protein
MQAVAALSLSGSFSVATALTEDLEPFSQLRRFEIETVIVGHILT